MNSVQKNYWQEFYKNYEFIEPSNFAIFVKNFLDNEVLDNTALNQNRNIEISGNEQPVVANKKLLDCGCGNGRDSYYLSKYYDVTGIDTSFKPSDISNCSFKINDFCEYEKNEFDIIYSRFTFHSITNEQHEIFLNSICRNQIVCIETRSVLSRECIKTHGEDHYRNHTDKTYIIDLLRKHNFDILYICEKDDIAIYKNENPICIRIIAKKM
jgi:SAM-dependent methyltransferase